MIDRWMSLMLGAVAVILAAATGCAQLQEPGLVDEEGQVELLGEGLDEHLLGKSKGSGGVNGDVDYCTDPAFPCGTGESDCDGDSECSGDLICGVNNGPSFGFPSAWDVCWPSHCENGVQDGNETGVDYGGSCSASDDCPPPGVNNGDPSSYCTLECPCVGGFGDCDVDDHCRGGFVCGLNNGYLFGMPLRHDVCWPTHCENGVQDGDETGVDSGGSCGDPEQCLLALWFPDTDGDGYGDVQAYADETYLVECEDTPVSGYVANAEDCNDSNSAISPDGTEVCNEIDDDCDGTVDDGAFDYVQVYHDNDTDSYGDPTDSVTVCAGSEPAGYLADNTDCDDDRSEVNPGEVEVCGNGLDDDCDGTFLACRPEGVLDANSDAHAIFTGGADDGVGYSFAAGDYDGDGSNDLAVGGPVIPWRTTPANPGSVYLMYGPLGSGTQSAPSAADASFSSGTDQDHVGIAVSAGDFDDDGADDLAIGASERNSTLFGGWAFVYYGGARYAGSQDVSAADLRLKGNGAEEWTGYSLDMRRDMASTSLVDLVVGAPGNLNDGTAGAMGSTMVLRGDSVRFTGQHKIAPKSRAVYYGDVADGGFGTHVAAVGDVGGDVTGDLAVGAPGQYWWPAAGDSYPGDVHVFFGDLSGVNTAADADVTISGEDDDDWVGVFVEGGDLDGDGINELIVSASGDSAIDVEAGKLGVFRGPLLPGGLLISDAEITVRGEDPYTYVGESAAIGDYDNDGINDLVVGAYDAGAYIWYGPVPDADTTVSGADLTITSSRADEVNFGWPVGFVGDLTGDGFGDLAVGDVGDGASAGALYILAGPSL